MFFLSPNLFLTSSGVKSLLALLLSLIFTFPIENELDERIREEFLENIESENIELDDIDEDYNIENNEVTEEEKEGMLDTLYIDEGLIDPEEDF